MNKRMHACVSGVVQGVNFRYFAVHAARGLGVSGFVRNLDDGRVEVVAEGEEEKLKQLIGRLRQGPAAADVKDVKVEWEKTKGEFKGFGVNY